MELKSADHIELILKIINTGTWAQDAIWENNKDDGDYVSVPLPDISYRSDGFLIIEQGRTELRSTGVKLYSNQEEMWQHFRKEFGHWPQFPLKKKDWKRLSRRKEANYLVRIISMLRPTKKTEKLKISNFIFDVVGTTSTTFVEMIC